ncbi:MFS transporter [Gimibacter soli]|uniref:MFS transporter n=1 Tax=Gimibacter soli TaxID=3024400 RepID=A0AAE9XV38_9PROT|nr:MFS transporter [Gimibacter soli]WCL53349.1 MFS transporter [Gimibacter soli]
MSRAQWQAIAVTVALSALDGFDVLAMTFAAPGISASRGIGKTELGLLLSSGLAGMALGSLFLSPVADRLGRRPAVLLCLGVMALGMALSPLMGGLGSLAACRLFTGVGIGGMVGIITPLAAEFANLRMKPVAVSLMTIGYPVGGFLGGAASGLLLAAYDWRAVFLFGAGMALLLVPLVLRYLPESPDYLAARQPKDALVRINRVLGRFGLQRLDVLPVPESGAPKSGVRALLTGAARQRTLRLMGGYFLYIMSIYYFLSWLPKIVADVGFDPATAAGVASASNLAGIAGGALAGMLASRFGLARVIVAVLGGTAFSIALFGQAVPPLGLVTLLACLAGFFVMAGMSLLYALIGTAFAPAERATGAGLVIGVGRGGAVLAPALAGLMFDAGVGLAVVSALMGLAALGAAVLVRRLAD